ncbi:MAG: sodium/proline symporter [Bacillota bacterium]
MTDIVGEGRVWTSLVLVLYMIGTLLLGFWLTKRNKSSEDFFVAGRTLGPATTGFSYAATQMSAGTVIGSVGTGANLGYNYVPVSISSTAAPWATFMTVGERIRKIAQRINALTYGDIFERRYSASVRLVYAILIVLFYVPLLAAQLKASANIMQVLLGWDYMPSLVISAVVTIIYTGASGMLGDAYTDLIQGFVMIAGFLFLVPTVIGKAGGFAAMHTSLKAINPDLIKLSGLVTGTWVFGNVVSWSFLQIGGAPHAVFRFLAAKDTKSLRKALLWAVIFQSFIFMCVGLLGPTGRVLLPDLKDRDLTTPVLAATYMHPILTGVLLSAVIAAVMSSVDSVLLLGSSAVTRDIYQRFMNPKMTPTQEMKIARWVTVVLGGLGFLFAVKPIAAVQWMVAFSFSVGASAFLWPIVFTCWWPRATHQGALAGMIAGAASCLIWYGMSWAQFKSFSTFPYGIWPSIIGVTVCLVVTVVVSLATKPHSEEALDVFYRA